MKRIILTILIQVFILTLTFIACEEDNRSVWELSTKTYKYINIKTISPSLGMIGAPINTKINIQFTEAIDKTKFPDSFSLKTEYNTYSINNFDILWKDNNKTVQLTPRVFLEKSTIYLLELDNNKIRSAAGNPLESTYSAAFTTGFLADLTPPTVDIACIQTNSGCVAPSGTIAPVNGVRLQFSEPMSPSDVENAFSFTVNGSRVPVLRSVWHTNANNLVDNKSVTLYLSNNTTNVPSGNAKLTLSAAAQDSAGNSLSNPIAANFIVGGANTTDYEVTNLVAPTSGLPSGALNGSFTIRNAGTINGTAPVSWKVYHSADRVFDGGDTLVQSGSHPQLNQNTTSAVINYSGTWPATAGYYHIIIVLSAADDGLAANNQLSSGAIAVGKADYAVSANFPASGIILSPINGDFTIKNVGSALGTAAITYNVYLSVDNIYGAGDTLVQTGTTAGLDSTLSTTIAFSGTWPSTGKYFVIITIDSTDDSLSGKTRFNNVLVSPAAITVTGPAVVDYVVSSVSFPTSGLTAQTFSGNIVVQNIGGANGGSNVEWAVYASTDTVLSLGDSLVTSGTITGGLTSMASSTVPITGNWPATPGNYYLIAKVSATDNSNLTNDVTSSPMIAVTKPTVSVPTFSVLTGTYTADQTVTISVTNPATASIIYTTDGTTPTASASCGATNGAAIANNGSVTVIQTQTLKAIGCAINWTSSGVATAIYTLKVTDPAWTGGTLPGTFTTGGHTVNIYTTTPGATVHYTINGINPSCGSTQGTTVTIPSTYGSYTIKAIGCKAGWTSSNVVTIGTYNVYVDYNVIAVSVTLPPAYVGSTRGDYIGGSFTVRNDGINGTAGYSYSVDWYSSTGTFRGNLATGSSGALVNTGTLAIPFGGTATYIPAGVYSGNHIVKVTITPINSDANTANNVRNTGNFLISTLAAPGGFTLAVGGTDVIKCGGGNVDNADWITVTGADSFDFQHSDGTAVTYLLGGSTLTHREWCDKDITRPKGYRVRATRAKGALSAWTTGTLN